MPLNEFLDSYVPFVKNNLGLPIRDVRYSYRTDVTISSDDKKDTSTRDLTLGITVSNQTKGFSGVQFRFERGFVEGDGEEIDVEGIAGYLAETIPGYDLDEIPEEAKVVDAMKKASLQFFAR